MSLKSKYFGELTTKELYEKEGFQICSEEFLEDGIPHVQMVLELR